jgi:hypothetical protein
MSYSAIELGAESGGSKYAADVVIIPEMVLLVVCEGCWGESWEIKKVKSEQTRLLGLGNFWQPRKN